MIGKRFSLFMLLSAGYLAAADLTEEEYNTRFSQAADAVERKHAAASDANSSFSIILGYKVAKAKAANDPALKDPYFIMRFADELSKELKDLGIGEDVEEPSAPAPAQDVTQAAIVPTTEQLAERKEQEAAKSGDVQAYLNQASKGHAGADPKLQARARAGDLLARAELEKDAKLRVTKGKVAAGYITEVQAQAERAAAEASFNGAIQQLQQQHQIEQQDAILEELRRNRR